MFVLKRKNKVYGGKLTAAEQKAMDIEIGRQCAEYNKNNQLEIVAMLLWYLRSEHKWGKKRLWNAFSNIDKAVNDLSKRYELGQEDTVWLCTKKLKEYGVDLEEWYEKLENGEEPIM